MEIRSGHAHCNGLDLYYEDMGNPLHETILLIMGLSAQLIYWPDDFCARLVAAGYRVVRFDNRDIGLSGKIKSRERFNITRGMLLAQLGLPVTGPYTLYDMAVDTIALMDALHIPRVHVAGVSMGGMISQILAADYPERIQSATLIMTSPLTPGLPPPSPRMAFTMLTGGFGGRKPKGLERPRPEDVADFLRLLAGSRYITPRPHRIALARRSLERSYHPAGVMRQMMAVLATGSLQKKLKKIRLPTLVIHGKDDPLLPWQAGRKISQCVSGARFELVNGLGHDLPPSFTPLLASWMLEHMRQGH